MKPIGIILPFRDDGTGTRTEQLIEALGSWARQTEGLSDVYVITDDDENVHHPTLLNSFGEVKWKVVPAGLTLMEKLNYHALEIADKHEYIQFLAHDIVLKTAWESRFIDFLEGVPYGMVYGNDLVHNGNLATHPCIKSSMIKAVGFYGCPAVEHNFFDNYWMNVARALGFCMYLPNVVMEHNHPLVGKAKKDALSDKIYSLLEPDQKKFINYMNLKFNLDLQKIKNEKPIARKVVDCFPFYDEFFMLDIRFRELDSVVDHYVIVESPETYTGKPKSLLLYESLKERYPDKVDKITIITPDIFSTDDPWERERFQTNHICKENLAHLNLDPQDIILVGDVDEIPKAAVVEQLAKDVSLTYGALEYSLHYYKFNRVFEHKWYHAKFIEYGTFSNYSTTRFGAPENVIRDAGWHLSYIKDPDGIRDKLSAFSHQEFGESIKDPAYIQECIESGKSLFDEGKTHVIPVDDSFPEYVKENINSLQMWIAE